MSPKNDTPIIGESLWSGIARGLVGIFFVSAGFYKLYDAFFFRKSAPLANDFSWWIGQNWPLLGMKQLMAFMLQHQWMVTAAALFVISFQITGGFLLFANVWRKFATTLLLIVQCAILFGVFHGGIGFQTFIGISIWLVVFYKIAGTMTRRKWTILTYWLVYYGLLVMLHRFRVGDPWPSSFAWQIQHYASDVMSTSVALKQMILSFAEHPYAPYLWASNWWIHLLAILLLVTRFRLIAGVVWLVIAILHEWVWLNGLTSEGTLWVLTLFTWLTFEDTARKQWGTFRMTPRWRDIRTTFGTFRKWVNAW